MDTLEPRLPVTVPIRKCSPHSQTRQIFYSSLDTSFPAGNLVPLMTCSQINIYLQLCSLLFKTGFHFWIRGSALHNLRGPT